MSVIVSVVLSAISIIIALYALKSSRQAQEYARAQVLLSTQQEDDRKERVVQEEWSAKFDLAVSAIQKIAPRWMTVNRAQTNAYGVVFPDSDLRRRIEDYLVNFNPARDIVRANESRHAKCNPRGGRRDT